MPNRSIRVSRLALLSRIGVSDVLGPGLDLAEELAWSRCCQQYASGLLGSSLTASSCAARPLRPLLLTGLLLGPGDAAGDDAVEDMSGRRHGRPLPVMPRHVVPGSLESERLRRDSGVFGMNGMAGLVSLQSSLARFDAAEVMCLCLTGCAEKNLWCESPAFVKAQMLEVRVYVRENICGCLCICVSRVKFLGVDASLIYVLSVAKA